MDLLTVTQAAEATGRYRDTILTAVKTGRLPGTRRQDNVWMISPDDLFKVYPPMKTPKSATITELKAMIDDLREDRNAWRELAMKPK